MRFVSTCTLLLLLTACGGTVSPDAGEDASVDGGDTRDAGGSLDAGSDAGPADAGPMDGGPSDAGVTDAGSDAGSDAGMDAGPSCLEDHDAGDRYSLGDNCNFCDCMADGTSVCTTRTCPGIGPGCTYDGVEYGYGERFPSTDTVNECVCAASGLACTRRDPELAEEGAILLESLDAPCGENAAFTPRMVLDTLPTDDFTTAFPYERDRELSPETLPDTDVRVRLVYDGGFLVCRIPMPTQPALDIEAVVELTTADGAFDEAFHTYLRRNDFGFLDAWTTVASAPNAELDGTYVPSCRFDPGDITFAARVNADGTAEGSIGKVCETDLLLDVGRFTYTP